MRVIPMLALVFCLLGGRNDGSPLVAFAISRTIYLLFQSRTPQSSTTMVFLGFLLTCIAYGSNDGQKMIAPSPPRAGAWDCGAGCGFRSAYCPSIARLSNVAAPRCARG